MWTWMWNLWCLKLLQFKVLHICAQLTLWCTGYAIWNGSVNIRFTAIFLFNLSNYTKNSLTAKKLYKNQVLFWTCELLSRTLNLWVTMSLVLKQTEFQSKHNNNHGFTRGLFFALSTGPEVIKAVINWALTLAVLGRTSFCDYPVITHTSQSAGLLCS